jgi:integrase
VQHKRREPGRAAELVLVDELLDAYLTNRQLKGKDVSTAQSHMKALRPAFGNLKAVDCTMDVIETVQLTWQEKQTSNAAINRRLNTLRAAFNLALRAKRIPGVPHVPHLDEPDRRGRHLSATDAAALDEKLPPYVKLVFMFALENGTRKGQLTRTLRRFVDLERGLIAWPKDECKAKEPHTLVLEGTSLELIVSLMKKPPIHCNYLFHGPRCAPGHRPSKRYGCVGDFKRAWRTALKAAGLPVGRKHGGFVFHHTRNTAVTNLRASGLEEADCMQVTGHQTARVFRHYDCGVVEALRQRIAAARTKAATLRPLHSVSR